MGIRADWRLAELEAESDDPFDTVILTSGLSIDLTGGEDAIYDGLRQTLNIESRLFNRGVTCELKDGGQDCLTCSHYTADRDEERAPLCLLGRDQRLLEQRHTQLNEDRVRHYIVFGNAFRGMASMAARYESLVTA